MELGLYTFADVGTDPETGRNVAPAERLRKIFAGAVSRVGE